VTRVGILQMSGHGAAPVDQTVELRDRRPGHAATAALLTDPAMRRHRGRLAIILGVSPLSPIGTRWYKGACAEIAVVA